MVLVGGAVGVALALVAVLIPWLPPADSTEAIKVDNVYWFPTYTRADDDLHFSSGDVRIRIVIQYSDYKRFGSEAKIIYDGKAIPTAPPSTSQPPPPQP